MPRFDYARCRECGHPPEVVGVLSHTRLCADCGVKRRNAEVMDLVNHDGPYFNDWRRAMAASVGAILLDDTAESA